jgi:hypothetical protein
MADLDMVLTALDVTRFLQQRAHPEVVYRVITVSEVMKGAVCLRGEGGDTRTDKVVRARAVHVCPAPGDQYSNEDGIIVTVQ